MALFDSVDKLVDEAKAIAGKLKGVKTHQLRRIYSQVQSIYRQSEKEQDFDSAKSRLILLKPQLAYAESRNDKLKPLSTKLIGLIDRAKDSPENLEEFYQYVQSVVAYHKEEKEVGER